MVVGAATMVAVFVAIVAYQVTVPLVAVCALPLAVLLVLGKPATWAARVTLGVAIGIGALWLTQPAEPPGYAMRAGALWATATFVALTLTTALSVSARALIALGATLVGVTATLPFVGLSWAELHWWAEHQLGLGARTTLGRFWIGVDLTGGSGPGRPTDVAQLLEGSVRVIGAIAPALAALAILLGLSVAGQFYYRLAAAPRGTPPKPFKTFRFSEHLGWLAIAPLLFLVIPRFAVLKPLAANVLVVLAALYGLRGVAVAAFFLPQVTGAGFLLWLLIGTIILLMLPAVVGGAIALGLLDAGLQIRTRWKAAIRS